MAKPKKVKKSKADFPSTTESENIEVLPPISNEAFNLIKDDLKMRIELAKSKKNKNEISETCLEGAVEADLDKTKLLNLEEKKEEGESCVKNEINSETKGEDEVLLNKKRNRSENVTTIQINKNNKKNQKKKTKEIILRNRDLKLRIRKVNQISNMSTKRKIIKNKKYFNDDLDLNPKMKKKNLLITTINSDSKKFPKEKSNSNVKSKTVSSRVKKDKNDNKKSNYCLCKKEIPSSTMIECSNKKCKIKWVHRECDIKLKKTSLKNLSKLVYKCPNCRKK